METSFSTPLLSALSQDASLAAIVPPSSVSSSTIRVQIYQLSASSCSLNLTLTHKQTGGLKKLVFLNKSSLIAGLVGNEREIVIWDLNRGVVDNVISASGDGHKFLDVAVSSGDDDDEDTLLYAVAATPEKMYVQEYNKKTKLLRKIKSGTYEADTSVSLAVTESRVILQTTEGIRIMNRQTGKKENKIKTKHNHGHSSPLLADGNVLFAMKDSGAMACLYDLETCKQIVQVSQSSTSSSDPKSTPVSAYQLMESDDKEKFYMLVNQRVNKVEGSSSSTVTKLESSTPYAAFLTKTTGSIVSLTYASPAGGDVMMKMYDLESELEKVLRLGQADEDTSDNTSSKTGKRKSNQAGASILGPGQAGLEASQKKAKKLTEVAEMDVDMEGDEDEEGEGGVSIADRLKMLSESLVDGDDDESDDEQTETSPAAPSFKPRKATTESLKEFLTQALESDDDSLIELALAVRDTKVIAQTLKEINPELVVLLLGKLAARLASTPLRAESLAMWISHCLRSGVVDASRPQAYHALASLRNLMQERVESFPDLLKLQGRLSVMCD